MIQHKELANGRWSELSLSKQLSNIGSEVSRTIKWQEKNNEIQAQKAFERALELIDMTLSTKQRYSAIKEICRLRELFCQAYIIKDKEDMEYINKYLFYFALENK